MHDTICLENRAALRQVYTVQIAGTHGLVTNLTVYLLDGKMVSREIDRNALYACLYAVPDHPIVLTR